ncbi:deoxyribose-phosphate aldolase [Pseudogracilibacillus sp. SE30717A]|uniref:deoxyribose-phosphate aldolase n=1 Tax=Pseudogracilibacillus sp. SE30717A TaxID=3098293 RepID=UPI00300DE2AB
MVEKRIASMIDHTLLKPEATKEDIVKLCEEAKQYEFATVCVNPSWVRIACKELTGSNVGITTVIGFPLGATSTFTKVAETRDAIASGATEVDMVIQIGALKSGDDQAVLDDMKQVVWAANKEAVVKVIIETGFLTDEEKERACLLAKKAGVDFVKTSTGFGPGQATVEDIRLMRTTVGPEMGVKASGGVRDQETAEAMIVAGANRIGASAGITIVTGGKGNSDY